MNIMTFTIAALRANISETPAVVLISEQGEEEKNGAKASVAIRSGVERQFMPAPAGLAS